MTTRSQYGTDALDQTGTNDELKQHVTLAIAFLLGLVIPRHYIPSYILAAFEEVLPDPTSWTHAPSLWHKVVDLQPSVDRFKAHSQVLRERGEKFPCVLKAQETPIPIDPMSLPDFDLSILGPELAPGFEILKFNTEGLTIEGFSIEKATGFFLAGLDRFLRTRLSASKVPPRPYTIRGGYSGLLFRVTTRTHGLKVHYTHQYYLNPSYVFGAPTTPVDNFIQPGLWHFGTSQGNGPVTWDLQNIVDIPFGGRQTHIAV